MPVHKSRLSDACAQDPDDALLREIGWPVSDPGYWDLMDNLARILQPESLEERLHVMQLFRGALLDWLLNSEFDDDFESDVADVIEIDLFANDEQFQFSDSAFAPLLGSDDDESANPTSPSATSTRPLLGTDHGANRC
jgi:hypothetical protein